MSRSGVTTIKDIARQLNVATSTVSRALSGHKSIGLGMRLKVQQLAREMSYHPNRNAIAFKQRRTGIIGLIVPNLSEHFFSEAISAVEDLAMQHQYHVLIGQSHDDEEREQRIVEAMTQQRVDGIIVSLAKHTVQYDHFDRLESYHIPVVFFDRVPQTAEVHKVHFNMESGTREAIEFLIDRGHRRIALLNGPECMPSTLERTDVYKEVLAQRRIKIDMGLVASTDLMPDTTYHAMELLLAQKPRPTAVLAMNDYVALDVIEYIKQAGLELNKDLTVISYSNLPISNYLQSPPLASVEQFPYRQGEAAADLLMDLILNKKDGEQPFQQVIIEGKLVLHNAFKSKPGK
ncbi:LacI family DNA-binding transcriptional regulator [Paraflavitalea sp. CAU 1676]|uniref:LacI family DNA-binding transcriptional regulator n=1 Tax=Paraflavitalea sp. CAU 1676 TaxID=3032598 RepID=UPI0023DCA317|nr:LacI family DNA-binding transcriptional regulator [Paraflavitalea sp. CAU 1676]MDF2188619.1 LacI family DNA-binding transcriptional regulator [Paraflavitalea sp. CAU 1676]